MLDVFQKVSGVAILRVEILWATPLIVQFHCVLVRRSLRFEGEPKLLAKTTVRTRLRTVGCTIEMIDS